jgi:hypothetical protein
MIPYRRRPDPPAQRGQPRRDGPDAWATPPCLIRALVEQVLPELPEGAIWEPAAGDGQLAAMIRLAGRQVIVSDLQPQDGSAPLDFLQDAAPNTTRGAIVVTNPPYNALDAFITRGLDLFDRGHTAGLVLLLRHDHLTAASRVAVLNRATREVHCNWRTRWIAGSKGSPRWSFAWITWTTGPRCAPLYVANSTGQARKPRAKPREP